VYRAWAGRAGWRGSSGAYVSTAGLRSILVPSDPTAPAAPVLSSVPELAVLTLGCA
jgi:hypothetical protein